jgi:hypothetical protein
MRTDIDEMAKLMALPEGTRKFIVHKLVADEINSLIEEIFRHMSWRLSNAGTAINRSDYEDLLKWIQSRKRLPVDATPPPSPPTSAAD